jgi:hypothetical protein
MSISRTDPFIEAIDSTGELEDWSSVDYEQRNAASDAEWETQNAVEQKPQVVQNGANGRAFENSVIDALSGVTKNTTPYTVDGLGTSIPDLVDESGNITEIKNVVNLSFTRQLQIQAQSAEGSFNLIVSPRTQSISTPLFNAVQESGGTIQVFDPATRTFTPW